MKIDDIAPVKIQIPGRDDTAKKSGADFLKTLAEAAGTGGTEGPRPSATAAAPPLAPVGGIAGLTPVSPESRVENAVNLLDRFSRALSDPQTSLAGLEPMAAELENAAEGLTRAGRSLPEGDGLKPLMEETAVVAAVEAAKFRRGDYV